MGTAYTPALKVSRFTRIRRTRRLPLKGVVVVREGQEVAPETVVARAELPGVMQTVRAASLLGVEPADVTPLLRVKLGDTVESGQVLAESRGLFGLFKQTVTAPVAGTVEHFSEVSGNLGIRAAPIPVERTAYIQGRVVEVFPEEGVVVETEGAFVQGIFGVGGERRGTIRVLVSSPSEVLDASRVPADAAGRILVGGSLVTADGLAAARKAGAAAVVVGGILDQDLVSFVGKEIGVAITGHEDLDLTLILTEGFGGIDMAQRTFDLLRSQEGKDASVNGATQIRAGVIRPEVIVPLSGSAPADGGTEESAQDLEIGTPIRLIREPYFGRLGTVSQLPPEPQPVPSGAVVRILRARLQTGEEVTVPRANVEIVSD